MVRREGGGLEVCPLSRMCGDNGWINITQEDEGGPTTGAGAPPSAAAPSAAAGAEDGEEEEGGEDDMAGYADLASYEEAALGAMIGAVEDEVGHVV